MISLNAIKIAASLSGRTSPSSIAKLGLARQNNPKLARRREDGRVGSYEFSGSRESYSKEYTLEAKISTVSGMVYELEKSREDTFD